MAVAEMGHHTLLARAHAELLETQYAPHELHEGHISRQLAYPVDTAAVQILVREILQKVAKGGYAEFLLQYFLAPGAYSGEISYVLVEDG